MSAGTARRRRKAPARLFRVQIAAFGIFGMALATPAPRRRNQGDPVMTSAMTRAELTEKLLGIKRENGWSWKHICTEIGGMSPVLITDGAGIL
jgi:hypothetical protein